MWRTAAITDPTEQRDSREALVSGSKVQQTPRRLRFGIAALLWIMVAAAVLLFLVRQAGLTLLVPIAAMAGVFVFLFWAILMIAGPVAVMMAPTLILFAQFEFKDRTARWLITLFPFMAGIVMWTHSGWQVFHESPMPNVWLFQLLAIATGFGFYGLKRWRRAPTEGGSLKR